MICDLVFCSSSYEMVIAADASAFSTASEKTDRYPPAAHVAWWAEKWATHDISVSSTVNPDQVQRVSEMYVWQRFIELSQARSPFPIKFNGMLYTANRDPNTDARQWGGLNWWQNARLPYYNMLTAGDSDELKSFLMAYNNSVNPPVYLCFVSRGHFSPASGSSLYVFSLCMWVCLLGVT